MNTIQKDANSIENQYVNAILAWLAAHASKVNQPFVEADWHFKFMDYTTFPENVRQKNVYDCGMYVIMAIDFLYDDLPMTFKQVDFPHFRRRLAAAILMGAIPDHRTNTEFSLETPNLYENSDDDHLEAHITNGPSTPTVEVEKLRREIARLQFELTEEKEKHKEVMNKVALSTGTFCA